MAPKWEVQAEQRLGVAAGRLNKNLHAKEPNFQFISFIQLQMYWYPDMLLQQMETA